MAKFVVEKNLPGVTAIALLLVLVAMIAYAGIASVKLGGMLYIIALTTIGMGFGTKEDVVAVGGVTAFCFLVILDIHKHIGVLG